MLKDYIKEAAILALLSGLCCSVSSAVVTLLFCGGIIGEIVVHTGIVGAVLGFGFWMIGGAWDNRKRR